MSHFSVAVFSDGISVDALLEPYQENNMGTVCDDYLEFVDIEDESRWEYEHNSITMVKLPNGNLVHRWDEESKQEGALNVEVYHKDIYATFDEFMNDYKCAEKDRVTGKYGYWENPNAKWDWWDIGGRFGGWKGVAEGKVEDFDFTPDEDDYNKAIRFWELVVEGQPLKEDEKMPFNIYKPEYFIKRYGDKETYATINSQFTTFAVITPDGEWHEPGTMGWFGCSSDTPEEGLAWDLNYKERFIETADPEWYLTIVDCHI